MLPPVPVLTAPTAAGKSALALRLAREYRLELVAADAFTVYRGLDIGTAKPTPAERAQVPHHLIDVADVTGRYDVAQWVRAAEAAVADILGRGRVPLVVGGTGFYLSALTRGLPLTPPGEARAQAALEQELADRGLDALLSDIAAHSPAEARRTQRNPRRVLRALEVFRASGRWPGEFGHTVPAQRYRIFAFSPPPEQLERRIAARAAAMLDAGWPREAAWLAGQLPPELLPRPTAWQALGYSEALAVFRGELDRDAAQERIGAATRQYTRRQLSWTRRQLGADILMPEAAEAALRRHLADWPHELI